MDSSPTYRQLQPGEPAPWFKQRSTSNDSYVFDTAAGRYIVLCFLGSASKPSGRAALAFVEEHRKLFDDEHMAFFGVSVDPADESEGRLQQSLPGVRYFWDADHRISKLYGATPAASVQEGSVAYRPLWVVLNPSLQVRSVIPFQTNGNDRNALLQVLRGLPAVDDYAGMPMHAPVIILPHVLEPALCQLLIQRYEAHGGSESGFMREENGLTVGRSDPRHKMRRDYLIDDEELRQQLQRRVERRVIPMIRRVHHFEPTRMERYLVGCYDAESGGHFRAHRDDTTKGTAHRRFAMTVNLNDDFEGGELSFPEFGSRLYKPPMGAAVIFSCSLLHQVSPMRRGRRYAFLPFIYDEAAAALRQANQSFLGEGAAAPPITLPATLPEQPELRMLPL